MLCENACGRQADCEIKNVNVSSKHKVCELCGTSIIKNHTDWIWTVAPAPPGFINPMGQTIKGSSYSIPQPEHSVRAAQYDAPIRDPRIKSPDCECGNKGNPSGQGHSDWCKVFFREF